MGIKKRKVRIIRELSMVWARCCITCTICFFSLNTIFSQYQNYTQYTIDDGFLSMITYDIEQDVDGYIWISTDVGLSRFNGKEFKNYGIKEGLEQNEVIALNQDNKNRIWLNSSGNAAFVQNEKIEIVNIEESNMLHWNFGILNDGPEHTWILSKGTLNYYDEKNKHCDLKILDKGNHYDLIGSKKDTSLLLYDTTIEFRVKGKAVKRIPLPNTFTRDSLQWQHYALEGSELFYSGKNGIQKLNLEKQTHTFISREFSGVRQLKKYGDKIWISLKNRGLVCLEIKNDGVFKKEEFLKDKLCSNFLLDKNNNLWVTTYGDGIYFFPKQYIGISNFSEVKDPHFANLQSILVDDNNIYIGKLNGELLQIQEDKIKSFSYEHHRKSPINRILKIQKINNSELILASDDGMLLFDGSQIKVKHAIASKNVLFKNDSLYINNYEGSYKVSFNDFSKIQDPLSISQLIQRKEIKSWTQGRAYSALLDSNGSYWVAHTNLGLVEYRPDNSQINHTLKSNILKVNITDMIELANGVVCLATNGEGLILIQGEKITQISMDNGLSSDVCHDLKFNGKTLFVGTNRGINIVEFQNKNKEKYIIRIVDEMNGLINNDARGIDLKGDSLFVVTQEGMSILDLNILENVNEQLNVQIESIKIDQELIAFSDTTTLSHHQNSIQINFNTLSYIRNRQSVYAYKMEGVDEKWIYSKSNETHYSDLGPGTYSFKIKHANAKNNNEVKSLCFIIEPHFTQTAWFKFLLSLLLLATVITSLLYFINRGQKKDLENLVERRTAELEEKVSDLADTNKKLAISNSELEKFAYVASHDLKSPLRSVASFIQLLSRKNEDIFDKKDNEYLRFITSSVNKMNQVIQDLLTLSKIGAVDDEKTLVNTKQLIEEVIINNDFIIKNKNAKVNLIGDFPSLITHPSELSSVFQNFIANAIKYNESQQPIVNISVNRLNKRYVFSIQDNGIGINPKFGNKIFDLFQRLHTDNQYSGTGIGLAICKKIIEKNGGRIWFGSVVDEGTTFYFSILDVQATIDSGTTKHKYEHKTQ